MRTLPPELISLMQYVELNKSNWWDETVDRSVLAILWIDKISYSIQKIKHELENRSGFKVRLSEVQSSVKRLTEQGKIIIDFGDRYSLTLSERQALSIQVDTSKDLEERVAKGFRENLGVICEETNSDQIWIEFKQKFIIPLVADLGIRVYEFFTKKRQDLPWISFLDNFLEIIPDNCRAEARKSVLVFMNPDNDDLSQFILGYLDAYLLISAYGLSAQTLQSLKQVSEENVEFVIFLDTNVIFSLLDLHTNPSNETVSQLMELVKTVSDSLKISFVVNPITLKETRDAIRFYCDQLDGADYPPNLAEAAKIVGVSGVYRRYFDRVHNAGHQINVNDYFEPYINQLVPILNSKGISIFPEGKIFEYERLPKVYVDIDFQKQFEDVRYKSEAKGIDQITKDVVLWHFVQDLRNSHAESPLSAKYWVLTIDYRFLSFDRYKKRGKEVISVCIHPSQLIQLLRFFIPSSPQIGKILLGTILTPLISRGFDGKAEHTVMRILKRLSRYEGIEDVPINLISKMLTDENLKSQLENVTDDEVENQIIKDRIAVELAQASKEILGKDIVIETKNDLYDELQRNFEDLERNTSEKIDKLMKTNEQLKNKIEQLSDLQNIEDEKKNRERAFSEYKKSLIEYILPILILSPAAWLYISSIPVINQNNMVKYLALAAFSILIAIISIRFVVSQGLKDKYVSKENWFIRLRTRINISRITIAIFSLGWNILGDYIKSLLFQ